MYSIPVSVCVWGGGLLTVKACVHNASCDTKAAFRSHLAVLALYFSFTFSVSASSPAKQKRCLPALLAIKKNGTLVIWADNTSTVSSPEKGVGEINECAAVI